MDDGASFETAALRPPQDEERRGVFGVRHGLDHSPAALRPLRMRTVRESGRADIGRRAGQGIAGQCGRWPATISRSAAGASTSTRSPHI